MAEDKPKIIVDDDWKKQAQAEKQRLAEEEKRKAQTAPSEPAAQTKAPSPEAAAERAEVPEPDFSTLVESFLTQALFAMGLLEHPGGRGRVNMDLAKFNIAMLEVLEQKTKGNLARDEKHMLDHALHQARMAFVEVASRMGPIG
ncbi:MAG: DUF1844 domain-containing protein [Phycisphaerae bacterium]|nr:DUF1844 domain-containing protein [Phycisphaerae bacterium]